MAGSYNHCVITESDVMDDESPATAEHLGKLVDPETLSQMLENGGDVYEAVEEMYGMIWYLADHYARSLEDAQGEPEGTHSAASMVEDARKEYRAGLARSPGRV